MVDFKKIKLAELEKPDQDYILVKCICDEDDKASLTVGLIYQALDNGDKSILGESLFTVTDNNGGKRKCLKSSFIRI